MGTGGDGIQISRADGVAARDEAIARAGQLFVAAASLRRKVAELERAAEAALHHAVGMLDEYPPGEEEGEVVRPVDAATESPRGMVKGASTGNAIGDLCAAREARNAAARPAGGAATVPGPFSVPVGGAPESCEATLASVVEGTYHGVGPKFALPMDLEISRRPDGRLYGIATDAARRARREGLVFEGIEISKLRGWRFEPLPQKGQV